MKTVKPKTVKRVSCRQETIPVEGKPTLLWVATDSTGRRFMAKTKAKADLMCHIYNHSRTPRDLGKE